jgi:hypothetical protein
MQKEHPSVLEVIVRAFETSKGKTVDVVIEHEELPGVTLEMCQWWGANINDSTRYRMWHPEDHISFEWEVPPSEDPNVKSIERVEEGFGEFSPSVLRIRHEDPKILDIPTVYEVVVGGCQLGPGDKPISWMCHEFKDTPKGLKVRSTFRLPADIPQQFIDALRRHSKEENERLAEFLPELYKQNVG